MIRIVACARFAGFDAKVRWNELAPMSHRARGAISLGVIWFGEGLNHHSSPTDSTEKGVEGVSEFGGIGFTKKARGSQWGRGGWGANGLFKNVSTLDGFQGGLQVAWLLVLGDIQSAGAKYTCNFLEHWFDIRDVASANGMCNEVEFAQVEHIKVAHRSLDNSVVDTERLANASIEFEHSGADIKYGYLCTGGGVEWTLSATTCG